MWRYLQGVSLRRIGVEGLVPAKAVDLVHSVTGDLRHPMVPNREGNVGIIGSAVSHAYPLGYGIDDPLPKRQLRLQHLFRTLPLGDVVQENQ